MPKKISDEKILQIKKKSALYLPDRPGEANMSAYQVKRALASFVTDANVSVIAEINRIVDEIEDEIGNIDINIIDTILNKIIEIEQTLENLPSTGFSNIIISREEPEDLPEGGLWLHIKN